MVINFARFAGITSLLLTFGFTCQSQGQIAGLGDLPGGDFSSFASDVSDDGSVVVGQSVGENGTEAFRWTSSGGIQGLGFLPGGLSPGGDGFGSEATGVSADGSVVVGSSRSTSAVNGTESFRWTSSGGLQGLGDLPGGNFSNRATDVSADGSVVVGTGTAEDRGGNDIVGPNAAFRWTIDGGFQDLGGLPDLAGGNGKSFATAVSADGSVVVGRAGEAGGLGFRWTSSGGIQGVKAFTTTGFLNSAAGVSADGSVIVGDALGAVRWTSVDGIPGFEEFPGFGILQSIGSGNARDVSADGSVVVGYTFGSDGRAFIYEDDTGIRLLSDVLTEQGVNLSDWLSLDRAEVISADGRTIVGHGTNASGDTEAFVATVNGDSKPVLLGDINLDNAIDFSDIPPFIIVQLTGVFQEQADCDLSGKIDFGDIIPFIDILSES